MFPRSRELFSVNSVLRYANHMIRDVLYAIRGFKRTPLITFTIVSTIALGLGLVTVAFTLLNALLFRVDQVPDVHEMYAVERPRTSDEEPPTFTRAQFDGLRRETNVFIDVFAQVPDVDSRVDGRMIWARSSPATSSSCSASTLPGDAC